MQHDLILVFPGRPDNNCLTYFAKNYAQKTAYQSLTVNQSKSKKDASL